MGAAEFDIIVLGATGVTGRQLLRHYADRMPGLGSTWAVAGRDERRCREALVASGATGVPAVEVDVTDPSAVEALVARASTLINLVGPYARFGHHVYEACARTGTDQIDVCGEIDWLAGEIAGVHDIAQSTGSRIVPACGFEALPFDLATMALARSAWERWGEPLASVEVAISVWPDPPVARLGDVVSGGTVRSGADAIRRGVAGATDVRLLDPRPHDPTPLDLLPWRRPDDGRWLGPSLPTPYINPAIVYRTVGVSAAHTPWFANDFTYRDGLVTDNLMPGVSSSLASTWLSWLQLTQQLVAGQRSPVSNFIADMAEAFGPRPGDEPSGAHLAGWTWRLDAAGRTAGGHTAVVTVEGVGHPGYRSTAALAGEAALALAASDPPGGVLTPALAFGTSDLERWRRAGCQFRLG